MFLSPAGPMSVDVKLHVFTRQLDMPTAKDVRCGRLTRYCWWVMFGVGSQEDCLVEGEFKPTVFKVAFKRWFP